LKETYGSSLRELNEKKAEMVTRRLFIIKTEIPKLLIKKVIQKVVQNEEERKPVILKMPAVTKEEKISITTYNPNIVSEAKVLYQSAEGNKTISVNQSVDVYSASLTIFGL